MWMMKLNVMRRWCVCRSWSAAGRLGGSGHVPIVQGPSVHTQGVTGIRALWMINYPACVIIFLQLVTHAWGCGMCIYKIKMGLIYAWV